MSEVTGLFIFGSFIVGLAVSAGVALFIGQFIRVGQGGDAA